MHAATGAPIAWARYIIEQTLAVCNFFKLGCCQKNLKGSLDEGFVQYSKRPLSRTPKISFSTLRSCRWQTVTDRELNVISEVVDLGVLHQNPTLKKI